MEKINTLLKFINSNNNWKELIQEEPYNITIKEDGEYTLLKYNQCNADFKNPIVQCCRGIILKENEIVCFPFYKFGNYGESYCDKIDWNTAKIQEKIDGSLIKLWYDNEKWNISTNGTIDAAKAPFECDFIEFEANYKELFNKIFPEETYKKLNSQYTYMFEIVSPYTRVVVNYKNIDLYHLGTRDNTTYKEIEVDIGIKKPDEYKFNTLEDLIEHSKKLSKNEEGYVVVDKNYNRIKVKSPAYVLASYLKQNGNFTITRFIDIIKNGEKGEFITYFPEYKEEIIEIEKKINQIVSEIYLSMSVCYREDRKDFAKLAQELKTRKFLFLLYDRPNINIKAEILKQNADKIKELIYSDE